jgi:hypothetical protein
MVSRSGALFGGPLYPLLGPTLESQQQHQHTAAEGRLASFLLLAELTRRLNSPLQRRVPFLLISIPINSLQSSPIFTFFFAIYLIPQGPYLKLLIKKYLRRFNPF